MILVTLQKVMAYLCGATASVGVKSPLSTVRSSFSPCLMASSCLGLDPAVRVLVTFLGPRIFVDILSLPLLPEGVSAPVVAAFALSDMVEDN